MARNIFNDSVSSFLSTSLLFCLLSPQYNHVDQNTPCKCLFHLIYLDMFTHFYTEWIIFFWITFCFFPEFFDSINLKSWQIEIPKLLIPHLNCQWNVLSIRHFTNVQNCSPLISISLLFVFFPYFWPLFLSHHPCCL